MHKAFKIDKSTVVDLGNKYGDITIDTWDKDSVLVFIEYEVSEKNREKLAEYNRQYNEKNK